MERSYWSRLLHRRIGRRRALFTTGGLMASAAFLAACGSDDTPAGTATGGNGTGGTDATGSTGTPQSNLLTEIVDSSSAAVRGGRFTWANTAEPNHFDGKAQGQVQLNHLNGLAYSALVRNEPGIGQASSYTNALPELARSWEFNGEGTELVFHLREDVKFHDKPPVSGRLLDAEDVTVTWDNFWQATTPNNAPANANQLNPQAPILSMEATDSHTVLVKFAFPPSYILQRFASMITGELGSIYPKETYDTFNPEFEQIGTGPFMLDSFEPSIGIRYRPNPEYFNRDAEGFLDEVHFPLLAEYSARLAQFRRGELSTMVVGAEDILLTKRDVPDLAMYGVTLSNTSPGAMMRFGWLPIDGQPSPFLDIRVRQALSMSFDRETHIDAFSNVSRFESEGLPVQTYWHTAMGYVPDVWLNPLDASSFGENARYYEFNVEEARALIDAAQSGYAGGRFPDIPSAHATAVFPPPYVQEAEVMDQYARDIGLNVVTTPIDYNLDYLPNYVTSQGQFSGMMYGIGAVTSQHPIDYWLWRFYSQSGPTSGSLGFGGPDGSLGDRSGDPELDRLIEAGQAEFDVEALIEIIHDLQRHAAGQAYTVARPGFADSFQLAWPAIENFATFQGDTRVTLAGTWGINNYWFNSDKRHR